MFQYYPKKVREVLATTYSTYHLCILIMAREQNETGMSKQEDALKRYIDDNLRRYEERHHAAQRENAERFAQIQDDQREIGRASCRERVYVLV